MAGFALGGYLFGKWIDHRGDPFRIYGILVISTGVLAALPLLLKAVLPLYTLIYRAFGVNFAVLSSFRFIISSALLIVPTTMMGGTLPTLCKFLTRHRETVRINLGRLYALNTFGAVIGCPGDIPGRIGELRRHHLHAASGVGDDGIRPQRLARQPDRQGLAAADASPMPGSEELFGSYLTLAELNVVRHHSLTPNISNSGACFICESSMPRSTIDSNPATVTSRPPRPPMMLTTFGRLA